MNKTKETECIRTVYDLENTGKVKIIRVDHHDYTWSGSIPCTGVYRCMFCGHVKEN